MQKALADAKIVADAKALADAKVVADAKTAAALASATLKIAAAKAAGTTPVLTAEEALASYNPNAGVWHANSTTNSPFGGVLQGLIAGYKNPYAAGNTNPTASVPITRVSPVASVPTPKLPQNLYRCHISNWYDFTLTVLIWSPYTLSRWVIPIC